MLLRRVRLIGLRSSAIALAIIAGRWAVIHYGSQHKNDVTTTSLRPTTSSTPTSSSITSLPSTSTSLNPGTLPGGYAQPQVLGPTATGPLDGRRVLVDPGHNGGNASRPDLINALVPDGAGSKACDTTGTAGTDGFPESTFTLLLARQLVSDLRAQGATVVMTRNTYTGVGPCVNIRAQEGNSPPADVAISLHADGAPSGDYGFTVLQPAGVGPSRSITTASHRLALDIRNALTAGGITMTNYLGVNGVSTRSDLAGLNLSVVPKVLVEFGNMKNSTDLANMESAPWRARVAQHVTNALVEFVTIP